AGRAPSDPCSPSNSVPRVSLFLPWISVDVVTIALPESRFVAIQQRHPAHPLGALPEVQMRDEQAGRTTVLRRQLIAVEVERDPRLPVQEILQRQVRRGNAQGADERERRGAADTRPP